MKIKGLIRSLEFKDALKKKLNHVGIDLDFVDFSKPLSEQIGDAEILINGFEIIDKSLIDCCPNLKLLQQSGIGIDGIDIEYCSIKGIYVANVPMANAISVAEHAFFLMFYLTKNLKIDSRYENNIRGNGDEAGPQMFIRRSKTELGYELYKKTILIIGLGVTGIEVAKRAKAFGMTVIAVTKHPLTKTQGGNKAHYVDSIYGTDKLLDVISNADIVSIHTPLNDETENMIGEKEISNMKPGAFLINVARAHIVNKNALKYALLNNGISGAGFDVFWDEPADSQDELLKFDNFILTPHIAGWTYEAIESIAGIISINVERLFRGQVPLTLINRDLVNKAK